MDLPPLARDGFFGAAAIPVHENDSAKGQLIILGGMGSNHRPASTVQMVDLATGACAPQPSLLNTCAYQAACRLPDERIVCAGGLGVGAGSSSGVWGPPTQGSPNGAWTWRQLPAMSVWRYKCCGCVTSDSRFAVLGGIGDGNVSLSSCEALSFDDDGAAHWEPLPLMHDARIHFACATLAGCIIVAGGRRLKSAEVYDVELNRWFRLPCDLPHGSELYQMGSAVM